MYWFLLNLPLMIVGTIIAIGPLVYQMVWDAKHPDVPAVTYGQFRPRPPAETAVPEREEAQERGELVATKR